MRFVELQKDFFYICLALSAALFCSLKGYYEVKDEPIPWLFPKFPVLPYGKYRFRLRAGHAPGAPAGACLVVDVNIIPKPK